MNLSSILTDLKDNRNLFVVWLGEDEDIQEAQIFVTFKQQILLSV